MSDDPRAEYSTGTTGSAALYGTYANAFVQMNNAASLAESTHVTKLFGWDATGWYFYGPDARYSTSSGSKQLKYFKSGETYYWFLCCEEAT
jgi:hypothetical protein